jgi:hypothetical protein
VLSEGVVVDMDWTPLEELPPELTHVMVGMVGEGVSCQVLLSFQLEGRELPVEFVCSADTADQMAEILRAGAMHARLGMPTWN